MKTPSNFLGWIYRARFIKRWNRMSSRTETDIDLHSHCLNVSVVCHLLGLIDNIIFNGTQNPERLAMLGLYHEQSEIVTGDLCSKIKYASKALTKEIKVIEDVSERQCVASLPTQLQDALSGFIIQQNIPAEDKAFVKAADDLVALHKTREEVITAGNRDFKDAMDSLQNKVDTHAQNIPAVQWFVEHFSEGYAQTLDVLMKEV